MAFFTSSLGKKYLMAFTGIPLILFLTAHMLGNLQIFLGPDQINKYAATLQGMGALLWVFRLSMLLLFLVHAYLSAQLQIENTLARPIEYSKTDTIVATLTSRTMIVSGLLILTYLIFHILHFTTHTIDPSYQNLVDAQGRFDVYRMMINSFSQTHIASIYLLAVVLLGAHIYHAASSFFQTLGLNNKKFFELTTWFGPVLSLIFVIGYGIVPLSVLLKWIS